MSNTPHSLLFTHTLKPQVLEQELLDSLWQNPDAPPASEDACLAMIDSYFPSETPHVPQGRGSDCAELGIPSGNHAWALSTDFFWENTHFRKRYFTPFEAGVKALAVAASDLAGAGAKPLGCSLGLMLPPDLPASALHHVMAGLAAVAEKYGLALSGGDLSRGDLLGFCTTVWGASPAQDGKSFFSRQQARPGDIIFLIGDAGLARVGCAALEAQGRKAVGIYPAATKAHLVPVPRLEEAALLARFAFSLSPHARLSLMDLSDGMARDLPRLLGAFGADLEIPDAFIHEELQRYAESSTHSAEDLFILGGEDFSLLGTCDPVSWPSLQECMKDCRRLGTVAERPGIRVHGVPFQKEGFDHFAVQDSEKISQETPGRAPVDVATQTPNTSEGAKRDFTFFVEQRHWGAALAGDMDVIRNVCREAWEKGLLAGFNGNASLRLPSFPERAAGEEKREECCLITRSGTAKSRLRPDDFALLSIKTGAVLQGNNPSTEYPMHLAVYAACPETRAILHTHPPCLLALSMLLPPEQRLSLPLFEAEAYRAQLGFTPASKPGGTDLASAVAEAAKQHKAVWLEQHGLMVHGADLASTLGLMEELEQLARIQLLSLGKTIS